jgi:allene oxide cyclase-like protein
MKRAMTSALIVVAVAGLAASCAGASSADVTRKKLSIVGDDGNAKVFEVVDGGKAGFGFGDQLVEDAPVLDTAGKKIGESFTTVDIVNGASMEDAWGLIDCSIVLDDGTIQFNGSMATKDLGTGVTVPVVGGTGEYAGAGGSVKMVTPDPKHTNMSFDLLLPSTD